VHFLIPPPEILLLPMYWLSVIYWLLEWLEVVGMGRSEGVLELLRCH
jgi:hypothetical protein